jgi:hypothetical protein
MSTKLHVNYSAKESTKEKRASVDRPTIQSMQGDVLLLWIFFATIATPIGSRLVLHCNE